MACNDIVDGRVVTGVVCVPGGGAVVAPDTSTPGIPLGYNVTGFPVAPGDPFQTPGMKRQEEQRQDAYLIVGEPAPAGDGSGWWWLVALGIGYVLARKEYPRRRRRK